MSTSHRRFTARIEASPEAIFDLIADMPNYGRWLSGSNAFGRTTEVSPYPVRLGTTYLDAGPAGERPGAVTGFDRPRSIAFHHTMLIKRGPLTANCDIHIRCTLEPVDGATTVSRVLDLTIEIPGPLRLAEPVVAAAFRKENARILAALKRHVEAQGPAGRAGPRVSSET